MFYSRAYTSFLPQISNKIGKWGEVCQCPHGLIPHFLPGTGTGCLYSDLTKQYGYKAAIDALTLSIKSNSVSLSNTAALAARITGYGIDTPPEPGPSLAIYDQVFLPSKSDGKEAILS